MWESPIVGRTATVRLYRENLWYEKEAGQKETVIKTKRQPTEWENIFANETR